MALKILSRALGLALLTLVGGRAIDAGVLAKVWELDLRNVVHGTPDASAKYLPVQLIRFSPDGQQLAVAVAWNQSREVFKSKLLILGTQRPEYAPAQIEIGAGIGNQGGARSFGWSNDGRSLFVAGRVVDPGLGVGCELPRATSPPFWPSFLVSSDRLIQGGPELPDAGAVRARMDALGAMLKDNKGPTPASAIPPGPAEPRSRFTLFDLQCSPEGIWEVPESWQIQDVAEERHVVAVTRSVGDGYEFLIVDPLVGKVIRRWPSSYPAIGSFSEGGRVLCSVEEEGNKGQLVCRQADDGKKVGASESINGGFPIATSARSSRIIASDHHRERDPRSPYEYDWVLDRQVVWDYRSGSELASWRPNRQRATNTTNEQDRVPDQFAISPDGLYVATGGDGIVRLFKIEP